MGGPDPRAAARRFPRQRQHEGPAGDGPRRDGPRSGSRASRADRHGPQPGEEHQQPSVRRVDRRDPAGVRVRGVRAGRIPAAVAGRGEGAGRRVRGRPRTASCRPGSGTGPPPIPWRADADSRRPAAGRVARPGDAHARPRQAGDEPESRPGRGLGRSQPAGARRASLPHPRPDLLRLADVAAAGPRGLDVANGPGPGGRVRDRLRQRIGDPRR